MKVFFLAVLCLPFENLAHGSESRIWFEGERMPSGKTTVPRIRDTTAMGPAPRHGQTTTRTTTTTTTTTTTDRLNDGSVRSGGVERRPDYSGMNIAGPSWPSSSSGNSASPNRAPAPAATDANNGTDRFSSGHRTDLTTTTSSSRPDYSCMTLEKNWPARGTSRGRPLCQNQSQGQGQGQRPAHHHNNQGGTLYGLPMTRLLARGISKVALDLERVLRRAGNVVFSPTNISAALALLLLASAGSTKDELYNMLGVRPDAIDPVTRSELHLELGNMFKRMESSPAQEYGPQFSFACALFVQRDFPIVDKFALVARSVYKADVVPVDIATRPEQATDSINRWISEKTYGRIKNVLSESLSPETKVVIANVLFFNGQWLYPFHARATTNKPFYVSESETVDVPTMVNTAEVYYAENKKRAYRTLGMPYKGGDRAMFIVVPQGDLRTFVRSLTPTDLEHIVNETTVQQVIYTVPRMKLESSIQLRRPLERLGVTSVFQPSKADLSNLAEGVAVTDIFHKVEIEVSETGTTAAATTIATLTRDGTTPLFRVDRPFLFFLYHMPTSAITFWGSVYKPTPNYPSAQPAAN